jgi:hypothetical protein
MDDLYYIASDIRKIENESRGQSYLELIKSVSYTNTLLFVKHGLKVNEVEAEKAIDAYLAESDDHDFTTLFSDVVIAKLSKAGYLPKALQEKVKDEMTTKASKLSQNNGKS